MTVKSFKKCGIRNGCDGIEDDTLLEKVPFWTITTVIVSVIVVMKISVELLTALPFCLASANLNLKCNIFFSTCLLKS